MNQATLIVGAIMAAFIAFVATRQRLGVYRNVVFGGAAPAGGGGGGGGAVPSVPGAVAPGAGGGAGGGGQQSGPGPGQGGVGDYPTLPFVP